MADRPNDETIHDPGHDAGATLGRTQAGEDLASEPPPEDLRDTWGNTGPAIGDALPVGDVDPGPVPGESDAARQGAADLKAGPLASEPTRDPSLSRAVDRAAAGLEPTDAGYDRSFEGQPAGPLGPDSDEVPPDADEGPGGQWGSSG
jgi:hypothetical protein